MEMDYFSKNVGEIDNVLRNTGNMGGHAG